MIRVYADMVADLFHYGHVEFLKKARALGDYLIVGVHNDQVSTDWKRPPILSMDQRLAVVAACRYVDEALPNAPELPDREWISKHNIDLMVHGDDMSESDLNHYYGVPIKMGIFRTVRYTKGISTTEIIRRCKEVDLKV